MNKSILANPAWYRDTEGRTGFKPPGWEKQYGGKESPEIKQLTKKECTIPNEKKSHPSSSPSKMSSSKSPTRTPTTSPAKEKPNKSSSYNAPSLFCLSGGNTNSMTTSEYENLTDEQPPEIEQKQQKEIKSPKERRSSSGGAPVKVSNVEVKVRREKSVTELKPSSSPKSQSISSTSKSKESSKEKGFPQEDVLDATAAAAITGGNSGVIIRKVPTVTKAPASPLRDTNKSGKSKIEEESKKESSADSISPHSKPVVELGSHRRDSSQSDMSKFSHKSVTFSDQVEVNEIERLQRRRSRDEYNSSSEDDTIVDLNEHLMPLRRALRDKKEKRESSTEKQPTVKIEIQNPPDEENSNENEMETLRVSSVSPLQRSASDIPEVSPTPNSRSWSMEDDDTRIQNQRPSFNTVPEFQPLPMPTGELKLSKTNTSYNLPNNEMQDSMDSFQLLQLNAPFPRPPGMSEEEWRAMIQSIYVAETSSALDDFNNMRDAREGESDSIQSYYLEDVYGPDIYQQLHEHLPGSVAKVVRDEMLAGYGRQEDGSMGRPLEDWERLLIGSLTRLHAEDSDNGSGTLSKFISIKDI